MAPIDRRIILNPDEPNAGDHAFSLYNKAHPITGQDDVKEYLRGQLRGLRGKTVAVTVTGERQDEDGNVVGRFRARRVLTVHNYNDIFGPGSAFHSAIKAQRNAHSNDALIVKSLDIQAA